MVTVPGWGVRSNKYLNKKNVCIFWCTVGFSMGGGIALQLALRHPHAVAGAFVFFGPQKEIVYLFVVFPWLRGTPP